MRPLAVATRALAATALFGAPGFRPPQSGRLRPVQENTDRRHDRAVRVLGPGKTVRGLDVTTEDGEIHPFYSGNTHTRTLTPADSLAGNWAPSLQATTAAMAAAGRWPITPAGRAIQAEGRADGLCYVEPTPFLAILDEVRTIEIGDKEVVFHFDNSGDKAERVVRLGSAHPADVKPSRFETCDPAVAHRYLED